MKEECSSCRYSDPVNAVGDYLYCRFAPPRDTGDRSIGIKTARFPIVYPDWWCGCYLGKKAKRGRGDTGGDGRL
jgi:hypothetical protein